MTTFDTIPDKPRLLVVDDREENLFAMKRLLRDLPVESDFAQSGKEALSLLVRHDYALAILDVQMPEMNGFELAELMSNNDNTAHIPIIFVTAISKEKKHVFSGYLSGGVDYLSKPFEPEFLLSKIRVFLKLYEHQLEAKKQEARFGMILNHVTDGWWEWDIKKNVYKFSADFKQRLGFTDEEFPNAIDIWKRHVNPEDAVHSELLLESHLEQGTPYRLTLEFRHKDGHPIWFYSRGIAMTDDEGNFNKMIGTYTDMTQQKAVESRLRRSNKELEQFAYIASHDLRAPLRGIQSLVGWIEDECEETFTDDANDYFSKLKSRVERMDALINSILEYSRIGHENVEREHVHSGELLDEVIDLLAPPKECEISISQNMPDLKAPSAQLKQVFSNLIGNSIKYNDKDAKLINIDVKAFPHHYEFSVSDNGPGIEEQFADKVFQLFQTLQPRDTIESTGVGLTVVKKIIDINGGEIWLDTTTSPGEGATFKFSWPKPTGLST